MEKKNEVQELMLRLMELASFNNFDGFEVVKWLRENRDLWDGVVMLRGDLIMLRDIKDDSWNVDTVYILASGHDDDKLFTAIENSWGADEVSYLSEEEASHELGQWPCKQKVIMVWWD